MLGRLIWFFDSGIGGLTVLAEFRKLFPSFDYAYFGDRANCPYGGKTNGEIVSLTEKWVEKLFDDGAELVILACNTATVHAIRYLQQVRFPNRKILWVTIPGAEKIVESGYRHVGVIATEWTVRIKAYKERVHILDDSVSVHEVAAPELVPLIEAGILEGEAVRNALRSKLSEFENAEAVVLGCTHYPLVRKEIERLLPWTEIVDPGKEAARKFEGYLSRHPETAAKITRGGNLRIEFSWNEPVPTELLRKMGF